MKFKTAFFATALVVIVHFIAGFSGFYEIFESFDIPVHFFGGFAMGMVAIAIHHFVKTRYKLAKEPWWFNLIFVLGFAMTVAVLWEFMEFFLDRTIVVRYGYALTQPSLRDTMADLAMGGLGGISAFAFLKKKL